MADDILKKAARIMASKGASKGGDARARNLTKHEKVEIARKGGRARQHKAKGKAK